MRRLFGILFCLTTLGLSITIDSFGQWSHEFNTDDLSEWSGDIAEFKVNENMQLQLNASDAGETFIYRSSTIGFDTVSFSMYHLLDFAPSDNNRSRTYIALSDIDLSVARGYFIEIGENGSSDGLNFYYLESGIESLIASATMGSLANEPAQVKIQIDIYPNGLWSVKTNYEGEDFATLELEFLDDQFSMAESMFFGLSCKFSASRADKFFYDDLKIQKFVPDLTPPEVTGVIPLNSNELIVTFSEPVLESEASRIENYNLNNGVGNPNSIAQIGAFGNQYRLSFVSAFDASKMYSLEVSGISDLNDNFMLDQTVPFFFAVFPVKGDLLVSEILFDPYPNGEDFIEIYNKSNKNIDLDGLTILNTQNEESKIITDLTLPPNTYLALTEEVDFLFQEYKPETGARIELQELPAFNNDSGNITIINNSGIVLDSFNYNENQHFQLIDDTEGVSLERISFVLEANEDNIWQSASESVRFATPGYENSNAVSITEDAKNFELLTESFSPNQDGNDDLMILNFNLEKSGYVANITIYDASGFKIKELSNNELLGNQGVITWDGTSDENQLADLGIYILIGKVFHPDGETKNFKLTTVLADFID